MQLNFSTITSHFNPTDEVKKMKLEKRDDEEFEKQDDQEIDILLGEIPHATFLPQHQQQLRHHLHNRYSYLHIRDGDGHGHGFSPNGDTPCHGNVRVSPINGASLWSKGSTSSSVSHDGSPPLVRNEIPASKTHYPNGFLISKESELPNYPIRKRVDGRSFVDEYGLSDKFHGMLIRDKNEDALKFDSGLPDGHSVDPYGFWFDDRPPVGSNRGNVVLNNPFEDCRNGFSNDYGGLGQLGVRNSAVLDEERRLSMLRLWQQYRVGNLSGSYVSSHISNAQFSSRVSCTDSLNFQLKQAMEHQSDESSSSLQLHTEAAYGRNCHHRGIQVPNTAGAINRAPIADALFHSQQIGRDSNGDWHKIKSLSSSHITAPNLCSGGNLDHYNLPMFNDRVGAIPNGWSPQSPPSTRGVRNIEAFSCEDSLIIQGKDLNLVTNDRYNIPKQCKRSSYNALDRGNLRETDFELDEIGRIPSMHYPTLLPPNYDSLQEVEGYIYFIAKDQHGCRFLQQKFDEGTPEDVQMIFNEIINHVVELMMNPFGNYLMQKLLDVCTEEQRIHILLVVTGEPGQLVKISLNTHGTRVMQKLIETLKTKEEISMVVSALEPGFLKLIKDLNGNHVVQRCLQCLSNEDNKFIFYAAAKYCVDIATHRHGCCVLQRCIAHSTGEHQEKLVAAISSNGLILAQDAFGNYVIQYILELKIPLAITKLKTQFEGKYVQLSTQKFSSNVVEKCLHVFGEESRSRIIHELLATSRFEQLLQHPFANYVIQSALIVSKGPLHASLVEAIRPYAAVLRTSPYCKRIFSRSLLKK